METIKKREIDLLKLNFEKNEHQRSFGMYKYDIPWTIDFFDVYEPNDYDWDCVI